MLNILFSVFFLWIIEYKEKQSKFEKLKTDLKAIKDNAKNEKNNKINELKEEKTKIEAKTQIEIKEIGKETRKSVSQITKELTKIKEIEEKGSYRTGDTKYDEKYKEILGNKKEFK